MGERFDAIIIGAGIIGASIGFALSKAGRRTLNVDRNPAAGYGSTSSSGAVIRTFYSTVDGALIANESLQCWRDWPGHLGVADERGYARYINTGCLVVKARDDGALDPIKAIVEKVGIAYEDWDADTFAARLPHFDPRAYAPVKRPDDDGFGEPGEGRIAGALYFPDGGYVTDPQLATHNLQCAAEHHGARFRFNASVTRIDRLEGRASGVTLDDGTTIEAPVVVNAAGPHSAKVNALAGLDGTMAITTRALRQEMAHVPPPPGIDYADIGLTMADPDVGVYSRPETGNHILIGSQDPPCDTPQWADPDDFDRNPTDQAQAQVMRFAQRYPALGIPNSVQAVVDLYDVSDDWIPVYDRTDLGGFYVAIGTSGNQFKNAPVVGPLMAHLIEVCEAGHDHDRDPVVFDLVRTAQRIDLGFYSRNRAVNRDSSHSVIG